MTRNLLSMPWYSRHVRLACCTDALFAELMRALYDDGFTIDAVCPRRRRIVAHRPRASGKCSCRWVLWLSEQGYTTRVTCGVEPRHLLFAFCGHGEPLDKLEAMERFLAAAEAGCTRTAA